MRGLDRACTHLSASVSPCGRVHAQGQCPLAGMFTNRWHRMRRRRRRYSERCLRSSWFDCGERLLWAKFVGSFLPSRPRSALERTENTWKNQNDAQAGTRKRTVNSCKNRSSCGSGRQARVKDIMTKSGSSSEVVVDTSWRKCIVVAQPGEVLGG
jgi:hypothetical protein